MGWRALTVDGVEAGSRPHPAPSPAAARVPPPSAAYSATWLDSSARRACTSCCWAPQQIALRHPALPGSRPLS